MSDNPKPIRAPIAMAKIREMKATIAKKIAAGELTDVEGAALYKQYVHASIAHVRDQKDAADEDRPRTDPPTPDLYEY